MDNNIIHNKEESRFELPLEQGAKAVIRYRKKGNHLDLLHSEVPSSMRGQGIGKQLVLKTFEAIEKEGYTATAYCSYIRAVAKRSDEWRDKIQY